MNFKRTKLSFRQATKDIRHNFKSSSLIIMVVAVISLPTIILSSLRQGYVIVFQDWVDTATPAKQLDINVKTDQFEEGMITRGRIAEWKERMEIKEVVPHLRYGVEVEKESGGLVNFDLYSTIPTDPALGRLGVAPAFSEDDLEKCRVILPSKMLPELGFEKIPESIGLILSRGQSKQKINVEVAGTFPSKKKDIYASLILLQYIRNWTMGYAINDPGNGIHLPAGKGREEALAPFQVDSCLVLKVTPFSVQDRSLMQEALKLDYSEIELPEFPDHLLVRARSLERPMSLMDLGYIENNIRDAYESIVIPSVPGLETEVKGVNVELVSSVARDPRSSTLLTKGRWVNPLASKLEVVLSEEWVDEGIDYEDLITLQLEEQEIELKVVGFAKVGKEMGFIDHETLFRLHQVKDGMARLDPLTELFEPNEVLDLENEEFLFARVHANTLEDVEELHQQITDMGYDIPSSSLEELKHYQKIKSILTKFVLLVTIIGGIACIASLFVLMYEAIQRKRNQIGIMKAIGISNTFIVATLTRQSLIYGLFGIGVSYILFYTLKLFLDNSIGHVLFGLENQNTSIFQMTPGLLLIIIGSVVLISLMAGRIAASSVKNIDPADIMAGK